MQSLSERRYIILGIIASIFLVFAVRLFFLQVLSPEFSASAQDNVVKKKVIQPSRGILYDRHGEIYVGNEPIFSLAVTPAQLTIPDTSVLRRYLNMPQQKLDKRIQEAVNYSRKQSSVIRSHIDARLYAGLQEHLWMFDGVETRVHNTRNYQKQIGANYLGYISEVDSQDIKASEGYYEQGDMIGRSGLERQYEELLRGDKGVKMILKDVHGRTVGSFADGKYDTLPRKGNDIMVSIDPKLQRYGERLMRGKVGSIVAIQPATGEILASVSSPTYDPAKLSGMGFGENFMDLQRDTLKPLFNRPTMAMYPPGSIFKVMMALTALNEQTISTQTRYSCYGGFPRNGGTPGCHAHPQPLSVFGAVKHSCNAFFAATYVDMLHHAQYSDIYESFNTWRDYMEQFGLGHRLGIDVPNEKPGMLPSTKLYDKWYGEGRWRAMTTVSNAIGQGEIKMTPLQMANLAAIVANEGFYITPHFFKRLYNAQQEASVDFERHNVEIDPKHFDLVKNAMLQVVESGTGRGAKTRGLEICGKTGTAQNPHGEDHSVFIAFAPKDTPKIAIATVVENAGYGGTWAAPICGLMIEKYLTDTISRRRQWMERRVLRKRFFEKRKPEPTEAGTENEASTTTSAQASATTSDTEAETTSSPATEDDTAEAASTAAASAEATGEEASAEAEAAPAGESTNSGDEATADGEATNTNTAAGAEDDAASEASPGDEAPPTDSEAEDASAPAEAEPE
jgi:penicillin-binding protein 2